MNEYKQLNLSTQYQTEILEFAVVVGKVSEDIFQKFSVRPL